MKPVLAVLVLLACACNCASAAAADGNDDARRVEVVDHAFGLSMPDPYRWMEGQRNAEFDAWLNRRGAQSRATLDAMPTLGAWRARLSAVAGASTLHGRHRQVGDRLFVMRSTAGKEPVLLVRDTHGGERVVFDPATRPGTSIRGFAPSPDGSKVALNLAVNGDEAGELVVYEVASGQPMGEPLVPVWSEFPARWLADGSGFFHTRMQHPAGSDPLQGMAAWLHRLDTPAAQDRLVARAGDGGPLAIAASDFPEVTVAPVSDWALLSVTGARASMRLCHAPAAAAVAGTARWRCVVGDADGVQAFAVHGDTLYLLQAGAYPNRRLLALDLRQPDASLATAREVIPERPGIVLTDVGAARDAIYVKSMRNGLDRIERLAADGTLRAPTLPSAGTIYLMATDPRQDGALISLEGWTTPDRVYRVDAAGALTDLGLGTLGAPVYPDLVAEETEATSADGTRVRLSIVRRRDLATDGSARALVEGYGGYGVSLQPAFNPMTLEWAQAGNVYAVCHARGGGENGDSWRLAGAGAHKQRGIEDFIACAGELALRGYTTPARTAGQGGSMGGVLAGGAYVTAPAAWGAMVVQAGILNPVRLLASRNGANQIAELGDPRTAGGLRQLLALDPYQRVRDGTAYPPLLLTVGLADQRVAPWHSGKFGARVLAAAPATPVLFRTDGQLGHFATSLSALAGETADIYAFLDATLAAGERPAGRSAPE